MNEIQGILVVICESVMLNVTDLGSQILYGQTSRPQAKDLVLKVRNTTIID